MTQKHHARLFRSAYYDGTNGTAVAAELPGASINSGGTGNTTLVLDMAAGGQQSIPPGRNIAWSEYPGTPVVVEVYDTNLTDAALAQIYQQLADPSGLATGGVLVQRANATTDANGVATFTWPAAFGGTPTVSLGVQTATGEVHSARITALSSTGATVHVARSPVVAVLGISVTAAMVNASGVVVHAVAVGAP